MAHTPVHLTYTYEAVTLGKDGIAPIFQLVPDKTTSFQNSSKGFIFL